MKKTIFYTFVIILFCLAATMAELNGKELVVNGKAYNVEIPEDMTAEDAFYEAFTLYLEAEDNCTKLLDEVKNVTAMSRQYQTKVEEYKASVEELTGKYENVLKAQEEVSNSYSQLSKDYEALAKEYKKLSRPIFLRGYAGLGLVSDQNFNTPNIQLQLGGLFFEKFSLLTNIEYNVMDPAWGFGISAGLTF